MTQKCQTSVVWCNHNERKKMANDTTTENPSDPVEQKENLDIRAITEQIGKLYEALKAMVAASQTAGEPMDGATEEKYDRMNKRLTALI